MQNILNCEQALPNFEIHQQNIKYLNKLNCNSLHSVTLEG